MTVSSAGSNGTCRWAEAKTTIRAISHWVVDWRGAGETGSIEFDLTRTTDRPVGEIQIVRDHVSTS